MTDQAPKCDKSALDYLRAACNVAITHAKPADVEGHIVSTKAAIAHIESRLRASAEPPHSCEDAYQHFLSYSGLNDSLWTRYVYWAAYPGVEGVPRPDGKFDVAYTLGPITASPTQSNASAEVPAVDEAMVVRILDWQPLKHIDKGTRLWQLLEAAGLAHDEQISALTAALSRPAAEVKP